jgi:glycosyltransferase involved in cell wall biosynthesis
MCCGAAVIVPQIGGSMGFVQDGRNGTVVDTGSSRACVESLNALIFDHGRRVRLQRQAIFDICKFFPEKGAYRTLEALFSATAKAGTA